MPRCPNPRCQLDYPPGSVQCTNPFCQCLLPEAVIAGRYRIETRRMNKGAIDILLKSDQRALHARIAVAWQIASEFIFPGHVDKDALSSNLAGLYFQAKIECRQNNDMLLSAVELSRTSVTARPAGT